MFANDLTFQSSETECVKLTDLKGGTANDEPVHVVASEHEVGNKREVHAKRAVHGIPPVAEREGPAADEVEQR